MYNITMSCPDTSMPIVYFMLHFHVHSNQNNVTSLKVPRAQGGPATAAQVL